MKLQGSLRLEYKDESYVLLVKTFLKNDAYYFYISDKEKENALLDGEILELTYTDSFSSTEKDGEDHLQKVPDEVVKAIEKMLLDNKQLWYY